VFDEETVVKELTLLLEEEEGDKITEEDLDLDFEIEEDSIGDWENQLGYRGVMEVWKHKVTKEEIVIESYEDCTRHDPNEYTCEEVWLHDENGNVDTLGVYNDFEEADREAKRFMRENPKGIFGCNIKGEN